jgi:hypothetical protein
MVVSVGSSKVCESDKMTSVSLRRVRLDVKCDPVAVPGCIAQMTVAEGPSNLKRALATLERVSECNGSEDQTEEDVKDVWRISMSLTITSMTLLI